MNELLWNILTGLFISITSGLILKEFFDIFLKKASKSIYIRDLIWVPYLGWQFFILQLPSLPWYWKLGINIVFIVLISIIIYQGKIRKKVIFAISFCGLWVLSEFLVGFVYMLLNIHIEDYELLGSVISKLLLIAAGIVIKRIYKNTENITLPHKYTIILGGIALGSILIVSELFYLSEKNNEGHGGHLELICSLILLFINIMIFRIYSELAEYIKLQRINEAYERQLHAYDYYIKNKEIEFENNRKIRHDLKQYCIYLLKLFEEKKYNQGIEFLSEIIDEKIEKNSAIAKTDNLIIDAIVNYKNIIISKLGISFDVCLEVPAQIKVDKSDLALILGNLLDNAIEATSKIPFNERQIMLKMKYDLGNLLIHVKNTFDGYVKETKEGELLTLKQDKSRHGFGLASIKKSVEKYDGVLEYSFSEKIFQITVLLYSRI